MFKKKLRKINKNVKIKFFFTVYPKIKKIVKNKFNKIEIGLLGISFKPNTDDVRESPGIKLARDISKTKQRSKKT